MIFRFSLYGFLKNQRYFESFLYLAFLQAGMTYFQIGWLVAFREICINIMETPSGAFADVWGRRRSMILSFAFYVLSFVLFSFGTSYWQFFPGMFFFAVGEAFRTGTHKAMIFDWLKQQGRTKEKTKVYGFTRSWSQYGSAVSVIIGALIVFLTENYRHVFWICIPAYLANIINFMGYPASLDGTTESKIPSLGQIFRVTWDSFRQTVSRASTRGLLIESALYDGIFSLAKDYLQPALKAAALSLPIMVSLSGERRTAAAVGVVFFGVYILTGQASRRAHVLSERAGGDYQAARIIWLISLFGYAALVPLLLTGLEIAAILLFVALYALDNLWSPTILSRYNVFVDSGSTATVLSIDSQVNRIVTVALAPLLGYAVDRGGLWTVGAFGAAVASVGTIINIRSARHVAELSGAKGETQ